MNKQLVIRIGAGVIASMGLVVIFVFQQLNIAAMAGLTDVPAHQFVINRLIRFIVNDAFALLLIFSIFSERKYLVFAMWVQLTGMVVFLFPYLIVKLYYPGYNGPLISFVHRLIVNPTLLLLLIPAFMLQKRTRRV